MPGTAAAWVARGLERCPGIPRPEELLLTVDLPEEATRQFLAEGLPGLRRRASVVWERPAEDSHLFGFGEAAELMGRRASTLYEMMLAMSAVAASARDLSTNEQARPRFFGGARFAAEGSVHDPSWDAFGGWRLVVPGVLIAISCGRASGSCTMHVPNLATPADIRRLASQAVARAMTDSSSTRASTSEPVHHDPGLDETGWKRAIESALFQISDGRYEKVVLARRLTVRRPGGSDAGHVLTRLADRYPQCFVFKHRAGACQWLGASPELLVALERGMVRAAALAGSRPSTETANDQLLADPKERAEHQFVVAALRQALEPLCTRLDWPETPRIMRLPNIVHLYTPFAGSVNPGVSVLDLVAQMHPTPAVGGWPRQAALRAIDRLEQMDRGWYAGPIGWVDFAGDGEFAVALRSGLLLPNEARLYAGAGIVEGSDSERELAETEVKLQPLRDALCAS